VPVPSVVPCRADAGKSRWQSLAGNLLATMTWGIGVCIPGLQQRRRAISLRAEHHLSISILEFKDGKLHYLIDTIKINQTTSIFVWYGVLSTCCDYSAPPLCSLIRAWIEESLTERVSNKRPAYYSPLSSSSMSPSSWTKEIWCLNFIGVSKPASTLRRSDQPLRRF
jgi:hypothetical protein